MPWCNRHHCKMLMTKWPLTISFRTVLNPANYYRYPVSVQLADSPSDWLTLRTSDSIWHFVSTGFLRLGPKFVEVRRSNTIDNRKAVKKKKKSIIFSLQHKIFYIIQWNTVLEEGFCNHIKSPWFICSHRNAVGCKWRLHYYQLSFFECMHVPVGLSVHQVHQKKSH